MAERTAFQQGIIKRYYEHFDTISLQRLSEIVSDIYMADANKPVKLWEKAKQLLSRVSAEDELVAKIIAKKDIQGLAKLVNELSVGMKEKKPVVRDQMSEDRGQMSAMSDQRSQGSGSLAPHGTAGSDPGLPSTAGSASSATTPAADVLTPDNLKRAMKAFRKRMKLTRLDDESKLGRMGNAMSGGKKSQVDAIMAPREFPKAIWDELVKQGKLKSTDGVFYQLIEGV